MLTSNILFTQGPWTPWQMQSMGLIGFLAGILFRKGLLRRTRSSLAVFGAFAAVVIFLLLAAEPMLEKLDRIKVKYSLVE